VQVVLGEAERDDGLLRFVLEAEGFDLVGLASSDEELDRVLRGARPSVVVLDGGISAAAAFHARECVEDAALVVVWPDGVSAVLAEERVDPSLVIEDLGDAVRRAADRLRPAADPIVVLDAGGGAAVVVDSDPDPSPTSWPSAAEGPTTTTTRRAGRRMQVLVAAATWFLVLTALAAIATAVPHVVDTFRGGRSERPSTVTSPEPTGRSDLVTNGSPERQQDRCGDAVNGNGTENGNATENGNGVRAQGCPSGGQAAGTGDHGGGRPDDPGSQGNGGSSGNAGSNGGSSGASSEDAGSSGDDVSHGRSDEEHGGSRTGMSEGAEEDHGRAGENGRSGQHG
jgi:type IV secretory pathway TrbD component